VGFSGARRMDLGTYLGDHGYKEALAGVWPELDRVLAVIRPKSAIAISFSYAVARDAYGVRWLLRGKKAVGIFTSSSNLMLLGLFAYLREELEEAPEITIANIREY